MSEGNGSNGLGENMPVRRSDVIPTLDVPASSAHLASETYAGVRQSSFPMQTLNEADTSLACIIQPVHAFATILVQLSIICASDGGSTRGGHSALAMYHLRAASGRHAAAPMRRCNEFRAIANFQRDCKRFELGPHFRTC